MISANKNNANNANANDANYSNAYYADFLAINLEPFVLNTYGWCHLTRFKVLDWPILAPPPFLIGRHFFWLYLLIHFTYFLTEIGGVLSTHVFWRIPIGGGAVTGPGD